MRSVRWARNALLLAGALVLPLLMPADYERGLLVLTVIYAIAGLSLDYIMGQMGQFSFGHAAFWGFGAYVSARLSLSFELTPWLGLLAALLATFLVGLIVGYIALSRTRGLELAIVTLGFGILAWLVALRWRPVTGGPAGLLGIPPLSIFGLEIREEIHFYYVALTILLACVFFLARLRRSRFGRAVRSIHENEPLASSVGIPPISHYTLAFALSTGLVGLSGALYAHHFRFVTPNLLSLRPMLTFVIIVVLGGSGHLWGPVVGSVIYVWASELLRVSDELRFLIFGVVLFLMILFMPRGVYPTFLAGWARVASRLTGRRKPVSTGPDVESPLVHEPPRAEAR